MTGTPAAKASISMRPNCSRQLGVVWLGAASTSIAFRYAGTSLWRTSLQILMRSPNASAQLRSSPSIGPAPTNNARQGIPRSSSTFMSSCNPLACVNRPRYPITGGPLLSQWSFRRIDSPAARSGLKTFVSTPSGINRIGRRAYICRAPSVCATSVPEQIHPAARSMS